MDAAGGAAATTYKPAFRMGFLIGEDFDWLVEGNKLALGDELSRLVSCCFERDAPRRATRCSRGKRRCGPSSSREPEAKLVTGCVGRGPSWCLGPVTTVLAKHP